MIIGITGTLGSGKGTVVEYLVQQKKLTHFSVTGFMRSVAEGRGITPTRLTYHEIANEFRSQGPTKLLEATLEYWNKKGISDNFVIESLHTIPEVNFVQSKGGIVIAVDADLHTRYDRIVKRGSDKDKTSFEDFSAIEKRELASNDPNQNNLGATMSVADFTIQNNGTLAELHNQVDQILISL